MQQLPQGVIPHGMEAAEYPYTRRRMSPRRLPKGRNTMKNLLTALVLATSFAAFAQDAAKPAAPAADAKAAPAKKSTDKKAAAPATKPAKDAKAPATPAAAPAAK